MEVGVEIVRRPRCQGEKSGLRKTSHGALRVGLPYIGLATVPPLDGIPMEFTPQQEVNPPGTRYHCRMEGLSFGRNSLRFRRASGSLPIRRLRAKGWTNRAISGSSLESSKAILE